MNATKLVYMIVSIQIFSIFLIIVTTYFSNSKLSNQIFSRIPIATSFLAVTGVILTILVFRNQHNQSVIEMTIKMNNESLSQIFNLIKDYYKDSPSFINSLSFDFETNNVGENNNNNSFDMRSDFSHSLIINKIITTTIMQVIENYFVTAELTQTSDSEVLGTFLSYCNSKQFQELYKELKYNVGIRTRTYIEKLFEINKEHKFKNCDEVDEFCDKFILSGQLNKYINVTDSTNTTLHN